MSKGYQNRGSDIVSFIDFNFTIFAMFKTIVSLIVDLAFLNNENKHLRTVFILLFVIATQRFVGNGWKCH